MIRQAPDNGVTAVLTDRRQDAHHAVLSTHHQDRLIQDRERQDVAGSRHFVCVPHAQPFALEDDLLFELPEFFADIGFGRQDLGARDGADAGRRLLDHRPGKRENFAIRHGLSLNPAAGSFFR